MWVNDNEKRTQEQRKVINLKKQALKTFWRMVFALVLVANFAALTISLSPGVALADGGRDHRTANVTFTKWVITLPANPPSLAGVDMVGVVGGDVGLGRYVGKVLGDNLSVPGFWLVLNRWQTLAINCMSGW